MSVYCWRFCLRKGNRAGSDIRPPDDQHLGSSVYFLSFEGLRATVALTHGWIDWFPSSRIVLKFGVFV